MLIKIEIEQLNFSVRTYNCLKRAKINTVDDLIKKTKYDILGVRNLGENGVLEVIQILQSKGLSLKKDEEPRGYEKIICEYCKEENPQEVCCGIGINNGYLWCDISYDGRHVKINFCPMCGRRLMVDNTCNTSETSDDVVEQKDTIYDGCGILSFNFPEVW